MKRSHSIFLGKPGRRRPALVRWIVLAVGVSLALLWMASRQRALSLASHSAKDWNMHDPDAQFTIVLNTFKREDLLRSSVQHYSQCSRVNRIHVNWAESTTPPDLSSCTCCDKLVTFALPLLTHNDSSLNTRFLPVPGIATDAVLSIDDDIIISCRGLEAAFQAWKRNPDQLVGWYPRLASQHHGGSRYYGKLRSLFWSAEYSIVLTKAAFLHRRYLQAYTEQVPPAVHAMVRRRRNCEDIAMQFLVSSMAATAPTFVWNPTAIDKGHGLVPSVPGISGGSSHIESRSQCVDELLDHFPPLRSTRLSRHRHSTLLWLSPFLDELYNVLPRAREARYCTCALPNTGQRRLIHSHNVLFSVAQGGEASSAA